MGRLCNTWPRKVFKSEEAGESLLFGLVGDSTAWLLPLLSPGPSVLLLGEAVGKAGLSDSYLHYISRLSVPHFTELANHSSIAGIAATLSQVWVSVMLSHKGQLGEATPGEEHTDGECGWLKGSYSCPEQLLYPSDSMCQRQKTQGPSPAFRAGKRAQGMPAPE